MPRTRIMSLLVTMGVIVAGAAAAILPMSSSSAAEACVAAYSSSAVYTGGQRASYTGHNWTAKWWTQGETPSTGGSGVWADNGACGGTGGGGGGACSYPDWVAGQSYTTGAIVRYTNGLYYQATHDNPG